VAQRLDEPPLPDDWIPSNQRSQAVLSMIDQPSASPPTEAKPSSHTHTPDKLAYNLVLIPRFADHQLTGSLAAALEDWVRRICLAWDWRADQLEIRPDYLFLRVELDAANAPGQAAQQLKADLARKVLSEKIEWNASLPSGRFFARKHLLSSGAAPDGQQISRFIRQVRQSQGLSH
jgi:REP element-mobilizing transposase RayT